jgi:acyl-coenzyme A thioesterase PaaI-like protein
MPLVDRLGPLTKLLPLPKLDGGRNLIRQAWDLLSVVPGGKMLFSRMVGRMAPYTGSIHPYVSVLRSGYCEVQMHDRRNVRNHLDCIHAVALANLAEVAGNLALAYSLPDDARFIVSGMDIEYVKKARGTITGIGESPVPRTSVRAQFDVPVTLRDAKGDEVARAVLHSLVGPKPGRADGGARTDVN